MCAFLQLIIVFVYYVLSGCHVQPPGQISISSRPPHPHPWPRVFFRVLEVASFRQSGACLSGQTSSVRRRCHRCWCRCDCDWSGCRWCVKVRAEDHGRPRGRLFQNKSRALESPRLGFPLKGESEAESRSLVRIHVRDAGRAALPGPFTSVLKKQGGEKKICVLGLLSALDDKKNQKCTLHSGYTQEYLLISSSLDINIGGISAQHK